MIRCLLIANRGEIALRVIRSARARGLRTVAVYSDADREAPHVRAADRAVRIGPTPAPDSYLNIAALLDAAAVAGADSVHPGYGFLSERADFARAVTQAGLTFVGPSAEVMDLMGRKDRARQVAVAAGVPVVPRFVYATGGSPGVGTADESGLNGWQGPVLVKAAAGGGGKGMRIVRSAADLGAAMAAAEREAVAAFGDGTLLIEQYVEHGRHIEVQILGDSHGNVVHLFERDCSAQRRHQKVLEEAPAPDLAPGTREVLLGCAVALAREVGYVNAGTVEFLVAGQEVAFLEMNTRLQVEHPVTEAVVRVDGRGIDLVDLQLGIAAGEALPFQQKQVTVSGHAIEARVYAEDAFGGFLPQAGTAELVQWPTGARVDAALESGAVVGTAYDPMLGKVIASGRTRDDARRSLVAALDDSAILGLTTNLGFVRALADSEAFAALEVDTAWLDANPDAITPPSVDVPLLFAAWALANPTRGTGPFDLADGWRLAGPAEPATVSLVHHGRAETFAVGPDRIAGGAGSWTVRGSRGSAGRLQLEVDGQRRSAAVLVRPHQLAVAYQGHTFVFSRPDAFGPGVSEAEHDGVVTAPMPGTLLVVAVAEGQGVEQGEPLATLEAMKMELTLTAPFAGTVTKVHGTLGGQVAKGAVLFEVTPSPDEETPR